MNDHIIVKIGDREKPIGELIKLFNWVEFATSTLAFKPEEPFGIQIKFESGEVDGMKEGVSLYLTKETALRLVKKIVETFEEKTSHNRS